MQLKGLVAAVAIVITGISLYQLSFTQFINSFEAKKRKLAAKQVSAAQPQLDTKSVAYETAVTERLRVILDSVSTEKVGFGKTYQKAKEQQLSLGLDLQGGMNVTLEVGLEDFIRNMAAIKGNTAVEDAIKAALTAKASSQENLITLFLNAFKKNNANTKLASVFVKSSTTAITLNSSDAQVEQYLRDEAKKAVKNTFLVLNKRIDKFGVAQPNINLDENKDIITVELAGVQNPEKVRNMLQASARLEFWETYSNHEIFDALDKANKAYKGYLAGDKTDSNKVVKDTLGNKPANTKDSNANKQAEADKFFEENPLYKIFQPSQAQQDPKTGGYINSSIVGYIAAKDTAKFTQVMNLDIVKANLPKNLKLMFGMADRSIRDKDKSILVIHSIKMRPGREDAPLTGESVENTRADYGANGQPAVYMNMNSDGTNIWSDMTGNNIGRNLAVALDGIVYSAPTSNGKIPNGSTEISGSFTPEETQDLANILKSGKLEAPARIVQEQIVGPSLGKENIASGKMSFLIAFLAIFALMLVYYNTSGMVANIALVFNLLFTIGVLSALGATLTMAGIAGLVLTIGMAVDTNVIIFERIKEELMSGKNHKDAINEGYRRSLNPVFDGHLTVLLTAVMLYIFGLGPVRGFATTQILGILLSLFCGILLSRLITVLFMSKGKHLEYFTGISKSVFRKFHFKFIEWRKFAYVISAIVLLLGVGSFFNGFDQGIEFKGGRSYTVKLNKEYKTEDIKTALKAQFGSVPAVKTAPNNSMIIVTDYLREYTGKDAEGKVQQKLFDGLKALGATSDDIETFKVKGITQSNAVQPTISDDLKSGAMWAIGASIVIIFIYILLRFRKWQYSAGTVIALLHDVFVMLAVFSFLRHVVHFPLEIDQHFIAALLTVIGFSMNDTVIVFDRIREYFAKRPGVAKATIINEAINDTLSRTIMTSLTVFLTILILFIFGGEATKGFAFAMLIGVITGTYSSIFVAAPVLVDLDKTDTLSQEVDKDKRIADLKEQA
jgi:SecD/SecF fusion protein